MAIPPEVQALIEQAVAIVIARYDLPDDMVEAVREGATQCALARWPELVNWIDADEKAQVDEHPAG